MCRVSHGDTSSCRVVLQPVPCAHHVLASHNPLASRNCQRSKALSAQVLTGAVVEADEARSSRWRQFCVGMCAGCSLQLPQPQMRALHILYVSRTKQYIITSALLCVDARGHRSSSQPMMYHQHSLSRTDVKIVLHGRGHFQPKTSEGWPGINSDPLLSLAAATPPVRS